MGSAHLILLESNDELLGPSCDNETVETFLAGFKSSVDIPELSSKDLRGLIARANSSLHSSNKYKGLLIQKTLLDHCNAEVFENNAISWVQMSISRVIDSKEASVREKECACGVISSVFKYAPSHPEVSKQMPSLTGGIVNSLLKNFEVSESFVATLTQILKSYPGSSGSTEKIKKKVFSGFSVHRPKLLCKCAGLLPRLGGSGKEGANHKEAWALYFKRFLKTYQVIQEDLIHVSSRPKQRDDSGFLSGVEPIQELLPEKKGSLQDLLDSSYDGLAQLLIVRNLISEFLRSPFPYAKRFQPSLVFVLSDKLFNSLDLLHDKDNISEELNVFKVIAPTLVSTCLSLISTIVKVCQRDVAPFASRITRYISQTLDLSVRHGISLELKMSAYKLYRTMVSVLGASSGVHVHAEDIIPKLLREIVPPKHIKEDSSVSSSSKSSKKKAKDKSAPTWKKTKFTTKNLDKKAQLVSESLIILSEMFSASGSLIGPSLHKDVQIVILRLCIDTLHQRNLNDSPFSFPAVREAIYELLVSLSLNPHFKFHSPLRYAVGILSKGLNDVHPSVQGTARSCLLALEPCYHTRAPHLGSESYLNESEMEKVMSEIAKVHETKIYIKKGRGESVVMMDSQKSEIEDVVQNVISSTSEEKEQPVNPPESSNDDIRKVDLKKPEENPAILEKVSEMEEIIKESKKKNSDEELIQTFYNQDKSPITIPEETLEKLYEKDRRLASSKPPESKRPKLSDKEEPLEEDDGPDLNEMLSSFVHKPDLSSLKRKFKDDYVSEY